MSITYIPQHGYFVVLLSQQKSAWGKTLREAMEKLL
jgi:hypothetical protein